MLLFHFVLSFQDGREEAGLDVTKDGDEARNCEISSMFVVLLGKGLLGESLRPMS